MTESLLDCWENWELEYWESVSMRILSRELVDFWRRPRKWFISYWTDSVLVAGLGSAAITSGFIGN